MEESSGRYGKWSGGGTLSVNNIAIKEHVAGFRY